MNSKELMLRIAKPINYPITKYALNNYYNDKKSLSTANVAKNVLVLAPHMDDETIGLGGTIKKHASEGADVHVALITDGSNSVSSLSKEALTKKRIQEMQEVKKLLGIKDIIYMGLPDGNVRSTDHAQSKLIQIIKDVNPDLVYCTLFVDAHPDHTETAILLANVIPKLEDCQFDIRLYEINCAIPPSYINCVVDISETFADKKQAIDTFQSQAIAFDGFISLNQWKTNLVAEQTDAVEVFIELSKEQLVQQKEVLKQYKSQYPDLFKQINRTDTLLWAIYQNQKEKKKFYDEAFMGSNK
ncbi:PIG-L family deacetylase [Gracilibacillus caseinilyticus]|uniref:PIG-L family deacetylase n=1 Tax=Gracilibacillus caseinilyticus TaxID=2932256 RepID=A0ABY4F224_9BACI|nr:PIG-L family deacetylase [Gracilibacillus caseinilyticus]UOQ50281.1 PIG-L family deacetylase [Gracilibacillus caseinilyticus]